MTAPQSPASRVSTTASTTGRRTAPAAPKLRDSCHACASSKLKCYKEKPTCSRCAKRGLTCEYVATKRGERKHNKGNSTSENNNDKNNNGNSTSSSAAKAIDVPAQSLPALGGWFTPTTTISNSDRLPSPDITLSSGSLTSSNSSSLFSNLLTPEEQAMPSAVADLNTDFDDFFASPLSFSVPDISDTDMLGQSHFFSTGIDGCNNASSNPFDAFPAFEDTVSELLNFSNPRFPPDNGVYPVSETHTYQPITRAAESPCFCLVQALGLMQQLFTNPSTTCTISSTQGFEKAVNSPTIQTVISKNEHTIEAVSQMLQCSCSQDGYLLAIIALIVFKVLGWYAAAARRAPLPSDDHGADSPRTSIQRFSSHAEQVFQDPAVVAGYRLEEEDSTRMTAQLVLSELHRVQRLVNQLSATLKVQATKNAGGIDSPKNLGFETTESDLALPLSAVMMDQLEMDLRKRLRTLSLEIVEGLRKE